MRSLILTAFYLFLLATGFSAIFAFALGYIWVDLFSPQQVSFSIITQIPISMIIGAAAVGGYLMIDRRDPPQFVFGLKLIVIWAIWTTMSTFLWAEVPTAAYDKWNWAIKTIIFAGFIPYIIRSRVQIEAMILTILVSLSGTIIAGGIKVMATGGGYEINLGLIRGNSGLAEGSTLATVCISIIPLILWARKHSIIMPHTRLFSLACFGLIGACILTTLGTFERTGLVTMGVLSFYLWLRSSHKILWAVLGISSVLIVLSFISGDWWARMTTITTYNTEDSALTRIAVWLWTMQFAATHPFGGGFGVYLINHFSVPIANTGDFLEITGRAFHSIWFEVLGEQGIVGIIIFGLLILSTFHYLRTAQKATKDKPEFLWLRELSTALIASTGIYLIGGTFVGIGFQPMFYYYLAASICMQQYVVRAKLLAEETSRPRIFGIKPSFALNRG